MRAIVVGVLGLLGSVLGACASDPNQVTSKPTGGGVTSKPMKRMIEYTGPTASAKLSGDNVEVQVNCPSGGYALKTIRTVKVGLLTRVELELQSPAEGEPVTQAFETKSQSVPVPTDSGPVHVCIQEKQRGATYVQEPAFKLAVVLERK